MPTFINPFQGTDPIAQAIADVGNATFGNTGQGALRKQQIIEAQRKNTETDNLGKLIQSLGAQGALADNTGQAMLFSSGYSPKDAADLALAGTANKFGPAAAQTQSAQIGAGQGYGNTADAENAKLAEQQRQFNQKPINILDANGDPVIATQSSAIGQRPVLSDSDVKGTLIGNNFDNIDKLTDAQQRVLGAAPKGSVTPHNYVAPGGAVSITYDGITDAKTGMPLQPGGFIANAQGSASDVGLTNNVKGNLQASVAASQQFHGLVDAMIGLTNDHPEAFGINGKITGGIQEATQAAEQFVNQLGGKSVMDNLLTQAQQTLKANGASPDIVAKYNPAIPVVDSLGPMLAYQAASVIAGQSGRSVSDKDVEKWTQIIGDPQGWLSSAAQVRTKLQLIDATVQRAQELNQQYLDKGVTPPDGTIDQAFAESVKKIAGDTQALTGATPPPQAAPGATVSPPSAAPVAIKNDADFAALPSGTLFTAPDGTIRKKP